MQISLVRHGHTARGMSGLMSEKVISQLRALAPTNEIVVFFAGANPPSPETQYLLDWLAQQGERYSLVDAVHDPVLSSLLEEEHVLRWLPILCAKGRLIRGGTLLKQLAESGQLTRLLEEPRLSHVPVITASPLAIAMLHDALKTQSAVVRLTISADLRHELSVDEIRPDDIKLSFGKVTLVLDQSSATRADGVAIDWMKCAEGSGFRIDNPNEVPVLRSVDCNILAQWINGPVPPLLIDARTEEEYLEERLPVARLLDASLLDALPLLDRRTPLAFYCKNGTRSQRAARHCTELGFIDTATLIGGMDAWKRHFSQ